MGGPGHQFHQPSSGADVHGAARGRILFVGGTEILQNGGGPRLTCARAFTDNDVWMVRPFFQSGLSQLHYHAERLVVDGGTVKSVVDVAGSKGSGFTHECEYLFGEDGAVAMKNKVVPYGTMPDLPRLGLSMRLAKRFDYVRWYGRGPHENYIDRATSAFFGVWASDVKGLLTEYTRPRDNGCRTGARWVEFTDAEGAGVRFVQSEPISFQALEYGWEELYFARHMNGERRRNAPLVPEDATLLNIDIRQTGLGGASCGPGPMDRYRFDPSATVEWTLRIEPCSGLMTAQGNSRRPCEREKRVKTQMNRCAGSFHSCILCRRTQGIMSYLPVLPVPDDIREARYIIPMFP